MGVYGAEGKGCGSCGRGPGKLDSVSLVFFYVGEIVDSGGEYLMCVRKCRMNDSCVKIDSGSGRAPLMFFVEKTDDLETVSKDLFGGTEVVAVGEFGVEGEFQEFAGFGQSQSVALDGDWEIFIVLKPPCVMVEVAELGFETEGKEIR